MGNTIPLEDPELTSEQKALVSQLSESQINAIDSALLSVACNQWRKVARVIGTAMNNLPNKVNGIPDIFYAQRVATLVLEGKLVAQGNLKRMRYSEVKLP